MYVDLYNHIFRCLYDVGMFSMAKIPMESHVLIKYFQPPIDHKQLLLIEKKGTPWDFNSDLMGLI